MLGVRDAGWVEAILRAGRSAFCDVQLLSAAGVVGDKACAKSFCKRIGRAAARAWIPAGWLCGDAEPRAFADERAEQGDGIDGAANAKAAGIAEDAEGKKARKRGATGVGI